MLLVHKFKMFDVINKDQKYGKGNRVHNQTKKITEIRCTVCGLINKQDEPKKEIKK